MGIINIGYAVMGEGGGDAIGDSQAGSIFPPDCGK